MKIVLIALIATSFFSCVNNKKITKEKEIVRIDSVFIKQIEKVEVITKDTIITTQLDSVLFVDTLFLDKDCPNLVNKHIEKYSKSGNIKATVSLEKGVLSVRCDSDSLKILVTNLRQIISYKDNELSKSKIASEAKTIEVPVIKIKYKIPKWVWLLVLFNIGYFGRKYKNPIVNLVKRFL